MLASAPYLVILIVISDPVIWPRELLVAGESSALTTAPPLLTQDHSTVTTTNSVVTSRPDVYQSRSTVELTAVGAL